MLKRLVVSLGIASFVLSYPAVAQEWVVLNDQTASHISASDTLFETDQEEKDYAWEDLDRDGWTDLVIVRKSPFTSSGKFANVLLMNESGVLTDRTSEYASLSDVPGDNGFNTPTNDRDVIIVDIDGDQWLDIVTATTLSDSDSKAIGHPRIYMNLGEINGVWQGFRHEDGRIPQIMTLTGDPVNPRFCSVTAADVTGDDRVELYFGDYDSSGAGGEPQDSSLDVNNRLFVNDGNGFFTDSMQTRMDANMLLSAFGAAAQFADINNDGAIDLVKQTSLNAPQHVAIVYNNPLNIGFFNIYDEVYSLAPYHISVGELNNDGLLDIVVTDDSTDRYMLQLPGTGSEPDFLQQEFQLEGGGSELAFGSNSVIADLDADGWNDVIIADVDVDIDTCNSDRTHIYRNFGFQGAPGDAVVLREDGNIIPNSMLVGVHDVAVFDINNDGSLDMVIGRCTGSEIWIHESSISFTFPDGVPTTLDSGVATTFQVDLAIGSGTLDPATPKMHYSVNDGPYTEVSLAETRGSLSLFATLPGFVCDDNVKFYFSASLQGGISSTSPVNAPASTYTARASDGDIVLIDEDFEGSVDEWTISDDGSLTTGAWENVDPNGTIWSSSASAPEDDASDDGTHCFVTGNGAPGGSAGSDDIDGGTAYLVSPQLDLAGGDAVISWSQWFFNSSGTGEDSLAVSLSNDDGATWVAANSTLGTGGAWEQVNLTVSDYVVPSDQVRVRFAAGDAAPASVVEAGMDEFLVTKAGCDDPTSCPGDFDGDGSVGLSDFSSFLVLFGSTCSGCPEDMDEDGSVALGDFSAFLVVFGTSCP
ncbi:MAG: FG-GAP-like repeat-containing protein [Phycisphaerales bacterium]|nr:FG-GAP-like repeat-containing protein [Phycisphaerales bacterium]